jgi:phosphatidate cytidylyltransferase
MLFHLGFYSNDTFTDTYSYQIILGFFILLWTNDTGAYLSGKYFGKHKLFERISPKKTWEGSIGGGILTLAFAYVLSIYFTNLNITNWLIIGVLIAVFGGLGDLVESMLKRSLGIKDSGKLLPGHGGILDRFDGLLLSVPFVYGYLQLS